MAEVLRLREAARLISVSPGRLAAAPGGGPGNPTLLSLDALQAFCRSEGLHVPDAVEIRERSERLEHAERSIDARQELETLAGHYLAQIMERQSNYFDLFLKEELTHLVERVVERVVDQAVERLAERFDDQRTGSNERSTERLIPAILDQKAAVLTQLRACRPKALPAGDRRQYKHPTKRGRVTIAGHPSDDVHPKTLQSILTQAGLRRKTP